MRLMLTLKTGIKGQAQIKVVKENTAKIMKSGTLSVFATPAMVALMEEASCMALKDYLEEELEYNTEYTTLSGR